MELPILGWKRSETELNRSLTCNLGRFWDAASTQAERCVDAECILANALGPHREASSERIAVEQDGHRAGADVDPPDKTEQGGCRGTIIISTGTQPV